MNTSINAAIDTHQNDNAPDYLWHIWRSFSISESIAEHSVIHIEGNSLTFFYEASGYDVDNDKSYYRIIEVYDIDAVAVQISLGLVDLSDIANSAQAMFSGREGVNLFADFLDKNNISYRKKESYE